MNDQMQFVRLPTDSWFPDDVKNVTVQVVGHDRILSPVEHTWDSFFNSDDLVTDDFMEERASQEQQERESF